MEHGRRHVQVKREKENEAEAYFILVLREIQLLSRGVKQLTMEALDWLVEQPDFSMYHFGRTCRVTVGDKTFKDENTEDAICAAYEALHVKPALDEDRTTLPDYTD